MLVIGDRDVRIFGELTLEMPKAIWTIEKISNYREAANHKVKYIITSNN